MKKNAILTILVFFINIGFAQTEYKNLPLKLSPDNIKTATDGATEEIVTIAPIAVPLTEVEPFLAFFVTWKPIINGDKGKLQVRFSDDGATFGEWMDIEKDEHLVNDDNKSVSQLIFASKDAQSIQLRMIKPLYTAVQLSKITLHFYNPGNTPQKAKLSAANTQNSPLKQNCQCPQPAFQSRTDWCPNGSCPPHPSPAITIPTHLIVHHSAGTNTSNDWAAVVRSIWSLHVNGNGWSDVGYNWLIDPNGVIYEGRGDNILGAHFCGTNGQTVGTCVMGNFMTVSPNSNAINALTELMAWKSCDIGVNPIDSAFHNSSGKILPYISGHRDGCATACPGDLLYPMLPSVRTGAAAHIQTQCTNFTVLNAPSNLVLTTQAYNQVALTWQDNSTDEDSFLIERSTGTVNNFMQIAAVAADTTTYIDHTVVGSTGYYYQVRAKNSTDTSDYTTPQWVATFNTTTTFLNKNHQYKIFPNPTSGEIQLTYDGQETTEATIRIFNAIGKEVVKNQLYNFKNNATVSLSLHHLADGIYWIELQDSRGKHTIKLVKH